MKDRHAKKQDYDDDDSWYMPTEEDAIQSTNLSDSSDDDITTLNLGLKNVVSMHKAI